VKCAKQRNLEKGERGSVRLEHLPGWKGGGKGSIHILRKEKKLILTLQTHKEGGGLRFLVTMEGEGVTLFPKQKTLDRQPPAGRESTTFRGKNARKKHALEPNISHQQGWGGASFLLLYQLGQRSRIEETAPSQSDAPSGMGEKVRSEDVGSYHHWRLVLLGRREGSRIEFLSSRKHGASSERKAKTAGRKEEEELVPARRRSPSPFRAKDWGGEDGFLQLNNLKGI